MSLSGVELAHDLALANTHLKAARSKVKRFEDEKESESRVFFRMVNTKDLKIEKLESKYKFLDNCVNAWKVQMVRWDAEAEARQQAKDKRELDPAEPRAFPSPTRQLVAATEHLRRRSLDLNGTELRLLFDEQEDAGRQPAVDVARAVDDDEGEGEAARADESSLTEAGAAAVIDDWQVVAPRNVHGRSDSHRRSSGGAQSSEVRSPRDDNTNTTPPHMSSLSLALDRAQFQSPNVTPRSRSRKLPLVNPTLPTCATPNRFSVLSNQLTFQDLFSPIVAEASGSQLPASFVELVESAAPFELGDCSIDSRSSLALTPSPPGKGKGKRVEKAGGNDSAGQLDIDPILRRNFVPPSQAPVPPPPPASTESLRRPRTRGATAIIADNSAPPAPAASPSPPIPAPRRTTTRGKSPVDARDSDDDDTPAPSQTPRPPPPAASPSLPIPAPKRTTTQGKTPVNAANPDDDGTPAPSQAPGPKAKRVVVAKGKGLSNMTEEGADGQQEKVKVALGSTKPLNLADVILDGFETLWKMADRLNPGQMPKHVPAAALGKVDDEQELTAGSFDLEIQKMNGHLDSLIKDTKADESHRQGIVVRALFRRIRIALWYRKYAILFENREAAKVANGDKTKGGRPYTAIKPSAPLVHSLWQQSWTDRQGIAPWSLHTFQQQLATGRHLIKMQFIQGFAHPVLATVFCGLNNVNKNYYTKDAFMQHALSSFTSLDYAGRNLSNESANWTYDDLLNHISVVYHPIHLATPALQSMYQSIFDDLPFADPTYVPGSDLATDRAWCIDALCGNAGGKAFKEEWDRIDGPFASIRAASALYWTKDSFGHLDSFWRKEYPKVEMLKQLEVLEQE